MNIKAKIRISAYPTIILGFLSLIFLSGCTTDFEIDEPYKEIQVVYGLMEYQDSFYLDATQALVRQRQDTVQYFKISKAFLNKGGNAYSAAKQMDSLYYGDELEVTLQEKSGSIIHNSYKLIRVVDNNKQAGLFASPAQILYRTPKGYKLNIDAEYYLNVLNTKSGVNCHAQTNVVSPTDLWSSLTKAGYIGFRENANFTIQWYAAKGTAFYDMTIKIHVNEWVGTDTIHQVRKELDWKLATYLETASLNGGEKMTVPVQSSDFYNFIYNALSKDKNLHRRMLGVEFIFDAGGDEIYTYINVNRPAIGVVQKSTEYTNVVNGYGIYSTRSRTKIFKTLDAQSIDLLLKSFPTNQLGFVR